MHLVAVHLSDFRCLTQVSFEPDPEGTTVITGPNGTGKTSLLEAISYLSDLRSFRGASRDALVRAGASRAIVRVETVVGDRRLTVEAEVSAAGRSRTLLNRQPVRRRADLHEALRTTVFSPEDVAVVRGGPAERRRFLDGGLDLLEPKLGAQLDDLERVVRQRGALLRQAAGRSTPDVEATLSVWDERLAAVGTAVSEGRADLVTRLAPLVEESYSRLAGRPVEVGLRYRRSWEADLQEALERARRDDLRRAVTTVGPHRDELEITLDGLSGRSHASQGEQRTAALALRLALHRLATAQLGSAPVLLLDDVFSELDPHRCRALLADLPAGQAVLTTAVPPPPEVTPARVFATADGRLREGSPW